MDALWVTTPSNFKIDAKHDGPWKIYLLYAYVFGIYVKDSNGGTLRESIFFLKQGGGMIHSTFFQEVLQMEFFKKQACCGVY